MEKWKIDFLEISNFSKKMKKGNERKITKNEKMGGARFARAPHFFIFWIFLALPFFNFLEKLQISRKSIFHFFIFFDFLKFDHFFWFFTKWPSHREDGQPKTNLPFFFVFFYNSLIFIIWPWTVLKQIKTDPKQR